MATLHQFWSSVRSSLWFVPSLMVAGSIGLAFGLIELSAGIGADVLQERWPRLFGAGEDGSRELLGAVAMSTITVTGVVFSVTVLTLSQAASQYSPRILRSFMSRWQVQVVLGMFAGIFTYSLVVLRTIRGGDDPVVHPLAVFGGVVLAVVGIGFLIFFIHHMAASLEASSIITSIAGETRTAIDRLFPEDLGEGVDDAAPANIQVDRWVAVPATRSGYIQKVESGTLLKFVTERNVVLRMECGIGDFMVDGGAIVSLGDADDADEATVRHVNNFFAVSTFRTIEQDAAFGIREIVDIAMKGLSPSINDETTTITCLDHLAALLSRLARRQIEPTVRSEGGQRARVIARGPTFESLVNESFDQIRHNARGKVTVLLRLLWCIETVADATRIRSRRRTLAVHLRLALDEARRVESARDRQMLERQADRAAARLGFSRGELDRLDTRATPGAV